MVSSNGREQPEGPPGGAERLGHSIGVLIAVGVSVGAVVFVVGVSVLFAWRLAQMAVAAVLGG